MKKNLMFFVLGVSTTLFMGAGISYWNEIRPENKYGVWVDVDSLHVPTENKYSVWVDMDSLYAPTKNKYSVWVDIDSLHVPTENKYGVWVNPSYFGGPRENEYALVWGGEIGDDAEKAMVVGFIHGMAVGKKKAKE